MGKITDFKIVKTNTDPKFIGKNISLEDVTHFTDDIVQPRKPRKPPQAPGWFKAWSEEIYEKRQPQWFKAWSETTYQNQQPAWFKTFETNNNSRFDRIETRLTNIETDVSGLKTTVSKLDTNINKINVRLDNIVTKNNLVE